MKKLLWLTCLCCICPLAAIGCGDDDTGANTSEDGGMVDPAITDISDQVEGINTSVTGLTGDVGQLNTDVDGLNKDVDALNKQAKDLAGQLADLAKGADPTNCSETESCIPDGVAVVQGEIKDIVNKVCAQEINCCTTDELNYKFGPAIQTVADCVSTFTALVNNGFSPNFLSGYLVGYVIQMAQALNDPDIKIAIDAAGAKKCLDLIGKQECPKFAAAEDVTTRCVPYVAPDTNEQDYCSPAVLVKGLQEEGELCGIQNLPGIPTCVDGLVCRNTGGQHGICATPAKEGDACTQDSECDDEGDLFCNAGTGKCQKRSDVGDPCAYTDPSFEQNQYNPRSGGDALAIQCKTGLDCNPKTKKCVAQCDEGALCYLYGESVDPNQNCPKGLICNVTETPNLYHGTHSNWLEGVCRKPTAKNKACTLPSECDSEQCEFNDAGDSVCQTALLADGASCDSAGQADGTCASGFCNANSKCATLCKIDAQTQTYKGCPKNYYCANPSEPATGGYACEPMIDNGDPCPSTPVNPHTDQGCKSGYCNNSLQCADKLAVNDVATGCTRSAQCDDTQYCDTTVAAPSPCKDVLADGATCTSPDTNGACGVDSLCLFNQIAQAYQCHALGGDGDACAIDNSIQCEAPLTCDGVDLKCYASTGRANGAHCDQGDLQCDSGWCRGDATCAKPIADGKACDSNDLTKNRCGENSYCNFPDDDTKGKCQKRSTAGQECSTRFGGMDCLKNQFNDSPNVAGSCVQVHDMWVCDSNAIPSEKLFCDGP